MKPKPTGAALMKLISEESSVVRRCISAAAARHTVIQRNGSLNTEHSAKMTDSSRVLGSTTPATQTQLRSQLVKGKVCMMSPSAPMS